MNKDIYATYDDKIIKVYQAFNNEIADETLGLGKFSSKFKINRMTWIKTSFLWMMYRSGWAMKEGQERILTIDLKIEGFREILNSAILSTYNENIYDTYEKWRALLNCSEVRCQWDPDRDVYGNAIDKRAIQLGLKGNYVLSYINDWIVNISDITEYVKLTKNSIDNNKINQTDLPMVEKFILTEAEKFKLGV